MRRDKGEGIRRTQGKGGSAQDPVPWYPLSQGGSRHGHSHQAGPALPLPPPEQHGLHSTEERAPACLQRQDQGAGAQGEGGCQSQGRAPELQRCPSVPGLPALSEQNALDGDEKWGIYEKP